jgi:hypothetical protein
MLIGRTGFLCIVSMPWCQAHATNPKYRSKKAASLSSTVCFIRQCALCFENLDTGGNMRVMAVPVAGMAPSRKALSMKARVSSACRCSSHGNALRCS